MILHRLRATMASACGAIPNAGSLIAADEVRDHGKTVRPSYRLLEKMKATGAGAKAKDAAP
jgi:hypothetical protein